ncbi:MAG: PorT family protein [Flavobacterium sp.]|nr:MAG: PorT family protein [Flavobacterium sp.]
MKKYFLLLLASTATFAQEKPKFGINTGATYSNIRGGDFADQQNYDINFLVGVSIEVPLTAKLSFVGNLNYERKTYQFNVPTTDFGTLDPIVANRSTIKFKSRLEYITIPLNLKYYIGNKKRFYVNGGAFLGVFLNDNFKVNGRSTYRGGNDDTEKIDFGANLGIGTNFKIRDKNSLNVEIRHNYGFMDINRMTTSFDEDITIKTNSFNLIANYQFDL